MTTALRASILDGCGATAPRDATAPLWTLMRRKSARELAAIREACVTLDGAARFIVRAGRDGRLVRNSLGTLLNQAERSAYELGAQDVRILFSLDGRVFHPNTDHRDGWGSQVYLAVRQFGYWVDGFVNLVEATEALSKAREGLKAAIAGARAGTRSGQLVADVAAAISPCVAHAITAGALGYSIGLAPEEPGRLTAESDTMLAIGEVISLQVGAADAQGAAAILSAMIRIGTDGCEVLWATPSIDEGGGP
jgi:Xaa-Pro aminopeptidase